MNEIIINIRPNSKILLANILSASLIFGIVSCSQDSKVAENDVAENTPVEDTNIAYEPVANTDEDSFKAWDSNADEKWDKHEFENGFSESKLFDEWDVNKDKVFSDEELNFGIYNTWDTDDDGFINEEEYGLANTSWEDDLGNNFEAWDANKDNQLDNNEFNNGIVETKLYERWDLNRDGMKDNNELNTGLYESWDDNDNGYLEFDEYKEIGFRNWRK